MDPFVYIGHSVLRAKSLNKSLTETKEYKIREEKGEKTGGIILDTFDNVLLKKDLLLLQLDEGQVLVSLEDGSILEQNFTGDWRFAGDLPSGPIADTLAGLTELRAFLPVTNIKVRQDKGALLDDEGKTRARYNNLVLWKGKTAISVGAVTSLRGYSRAYNDLIDILKGHDCTALDKAAEIFGLLGVKVNNYTSKPALPLVASAPASETAAIIIREFMRTARLNESGVIADYDTEIKCLLDKPVGVFSRYCSIDYVKEHLGWEPKISLEEGLKRVYDAVAAKELGND